MSARIGILFLFMFLPLTSNAEKGAFKLSVGTQKHMLDPSCIESIHYVRQDEIDSENLIFRLTDECGERMAKLTVENMGKKLTVSYLDNELFTALILQRLKSNFRFSTKGTPRVALMQVIDDYGVAVE